jgi:hypothetical protein
MIADPKNDRTCLGRLTELAREMAANPDPALVELAQRFRTLDELIAWVRSLPQRDDLGDPNDGPRLDACTPPQRLRVAPKTPNCFERTLLYLVLAELIDARHTRYARTVDLPTGRHTLPIENGEPVVLDPRVTRNAVRSSMFRTQARNCTAPIALSPEEAIDWIVAVAAEPAENFAHGPERVRRGHRVLRGVLRGRPICVSELPDVAFTLALADREAPLYGDAGRRIVQSTLLAIDRLDQRASAALMAPGCAGADTRNAGLELRIGNTTIAPDWNLLGALGRIGARVGGEVAVAAIQTKLATLGITPSMLGAAEHELNQEGYTLGPLAKPAPILGSLDAMTPQALAGRWVAGKLPL